MGYASRAAPSSTPMAGSVTRSGRSTPVARTRNGVGWPAEASCSSPARGFSWPKSTVTKRSLSRVEVGLLQQSVAELLERLAGPRRPGQLAAVHGGAQHELGDEGGGHGVDALAGHVADGEREAARRRPRVVVEEVAAAEHAGAGRAVRERDVEAGELGAAPTAAGAAAGARPRRRAWRARPRAAAARGHRRLADALQSTSAWTASAQIAMTMTRSNAQADHADQEGEDERPEQRAGQHAPDEAPPQAQQQQLAAHAAAARVVVEVAGPASVERAAEVAAVGRVDAALERQPDPLPQQAVLGAGEVLDQGEEAVVRREPGAHHADVQVETVLVGVVLDLAPPAAAAEEAAQEPVEVAGDALDVRSLHHAHGPIVPIPRFIGSRAREVESGGPGGPSAIECPTWWCGLRPRQTDVQELP